MAKIRRNWNKLNLAQRLSRGKDVAEGLAANANVPTPNDPYTEFLAAYTEAAASDDAVKASELRLRADQCERAAKVDRMVQKLQTLASYVEAVCNFDAAKLASTRFELLDANVSNAPKAVTEAMNLVLTAGDHEGEVDASWTPVPGARAYETQIAHTPMDPAAWKPYQFAQTRASLILTGQPSGQRIWVRVRALAAGHQLPGPWSDPATVRVP